MDVRPFNSTYGARSLTIVGYEPAATAGAPVYVFLPGTTMLRRRGRLMNHEVDFVVHMAAQHGFVSAVIEYEDWSTYNPGTCAYFEGKARALFDRSDGALAAVCGRAQADCSLGIAVHGFSQGAHLATIAASMDPRVSAALTYGNGVRCQGDWTDSWHDGAHMAMSARPMLPCMSGAVVSRFLPAHRRRSIVGADDAYFGGARGSVPPVHDSQRLLSEAYGCAADADECLRPDGSGYVVVRAGDVGHSHASHAFFLDFSRPAASNYSTDALNAPFAHGDANWCMRPSLSWLATTARRPLAGGERSAGDVEEQPPNAKPPQPALAAVAAVALGLAPFALFACAFSLRRRRMDRVLAERGIVSQAEIDKFSRPFHVASARELANG
jgi:hypothetical protein